jgi:predicted XRE-type DNA-binding protein
MRNGDHVTKGSVLDELGFPPETTLELKLKAELHQGILRIVRKHRYSATELEHVLGLRQPRMSELMRGKLNLLSVKTLLRYADKLGGYARVTVREKRARAA